MGVAMPRWWKNLGLQARFMMIASAGVLGLVACTFALVSWFELASVEQKLQTFSENELKSLNSLVESAMERRLEDSQNVAIKVFNGWFESRNRDYRGRLWSVWEPKTTAFMAKAAPEQPPKMALDDIDDEVLRTGQPVGRFVKDTYRYSMPIILGNSVGTRKEVCTPCHEAGMGQKKGEVIAVFSSSLSTTEDFAAFRRLIWFMGSGAVLAVLVVVAAMRLLLGRIITHPLTGMTSAMQRLAEGDSTVEIPAQERKDEIGAMAGAVQVFKQNAIENERLQSEQKAEQSRKEQRQIAVEQHIAVFEQSVRGALDHLGSAATDMRSTSQRMSTTAEETTVQSAAVATAVEQVTTNMQTVASAAEELSSSVAEIGRQVSHSSTIAGQAVEEAGRTNVTVHGLSEAAQKIGDVVKLISDIASQTNLLALNATIEAARAGEAGKGFAVVAAEVKSLATQTARATDDISSQVNAMQGATQQAVQAIQNITGTINSMNEIAGAIAAAVEEQGSATQEIARNVQEAATGAHEVSSNIAGVSQAAGETSTVAGQVLSSAGDLGKRAETLRVDVGTFLANIRAA
jgi:methyl-accepting chemotaxis protein